MSSFFHWLGGKKLLVKEILKHIPEHKLYVEPFLGSGTVFLAKAPSGKEILNDLNRDLVTLWRVVQHHPEEFRRQYASILHSRDEFQRFAAMNPETLTDVLRAVRFYFLILVSYAGDPDYSYSLETDPSRRSKVTLESVSRSLEAVQARMRRANLVIECRDWKWILERCDSLETFFFMDPPYWGFEDCYGKQLFTRQDFFDLAERLKRLKGRFLLTLNDLPEVREIFSAFSIEPVGVTYLAGTASGKGKRVGELLITNYPLREVRMLLDE